MNNIQYDEKLVVSVIIPVYNASKFLARAVDSALSQEETAEVILVEDGSEDGSYTVCREISNQHENVFVFTHEGHRNLGAGASRNLGVEKSSYEYIAFLDADDFYLENRFSVTKEVFQSYPEADGVYEAIGVWFDNADVEKRWKLGNGRKLTTIKKNISPDNLFWKQSPIGTSGFTHLNGLTVRKQVFKKSGFFDPELRLHQDTDFFMRLAISCNLYPGKLDRPVAKRGVHSGNRISKQRSIEEVINHRIKMWRSTHDWAVKFGYVKEAKELKKKIKYCRLDLVNTQGETDLSKNLMQYSITIKQSPEVLMDIRFYKKFWDCFWMSISSFIRRNKFQ